MYLFCLVFINMSSEKELSARDLSILNLIFDKSDSETKSPECFQVKTDSANVEDRDEEESTEDILNSKALEVEGIKLTEHGDFVEALEKFNLSIEKSTHRPSPYNNRAQLYRFLNEDDSKLCVCVYFLNECQ